MDKYFPQETCPKMCESLVQHQETLTQGRPVQGTRKSNILKWLHINFLNLLLISSEFDISDSD